MDAVTVIEWIEDRRANCERIAATKTGPDREGWLEDERYFAAAVDKLISATALMQKLADDLKVSPEDVGKVMDELIRAHKSRTLQ